MARRKIDVAVKIEVLLALRNPDVNIPELAKLHGVSVPTIYNWRKTLPALVSAEPTL